MKCMENLQMMQTSFHLIRCVDIETLAKTMAELLLPTETHVND